MSKQNPSHEDRLIALEKRMDGLENSLLSAIRDLGVMVSQMISLRQATGHDHDHHHTAPAQPSLVVQVHTQLTENTMFRMYQDAHDHPVNPGQIHIHTRREQDSQFFDNLDVDPVVQQLLVDEFQKQTGGTINVAFYVEVYHQSAQPIDSTSILCDAQVAAPLAPANQPSEELPAVKQGVYAQLTPAQQMQQMVAGLTEQVRARVPLGDSRTGLPGAGQSR